MLFSEMCDRCSKDVLIFLKCVRVCVCEIKYRYEINFLNEPCRHETTYINVHSTLHLAESCSLPRAFVEVWSLRQAANM